MPIMNYARYSAAVLAFALLCIGFTNPVLAQRRTRYQPYWTIGGMLGFTQNVTDITFAPSESKGISSALQGYTGGLTQSGLAVGANVQYHFMPHISGRVGLTYGNFYSSEGKATGLRKDFNRSFSSTVFELSAIAVFHLKTAGRGFYYRPKFNPYVFGGLAVYYGSGTVSPVPQFSGTPVGGFPITSYTVISPSIPLGIGFDYRLTRNIDIGFEYGLRYSLSDKFDGLTNILEVSTVAPASVVDIGKTAGSDAYFFGGVTIKYIITDPNKCPTPSSGKRGIWPFNRIFGRR